MVECLVRHLSSSRCDLLRSFIHFKPPSNGHGLHHTFRRDLPPEHPNARSLPQTWRPGRRGGIRHGVFAQPSLAHRQVTAASPDCRKPRPPSRFHWRALVSPQPLGRRHLPSAARERQRLLSERAVLRVAASPSSVADLGPHPLPEAEPTATTDDKRRSPLSLRGVVLGFRVATSLREATAALCTEARPSSAMALEALEQRTAAWIRR